MRLRRLQRKTTNDVGGEDSFLDVIANLVGVLLILVVVVGANAGSDMVKEAIGRVDDGEIEQLAGSCHTAAREADSLHQDNIQMEQKIAMERALADQRENERHELLVRLAMARNEFDARQQKLDEQGRKSLEQSRDAEALRQKLAGYTSVIQELSSQTVEEETITHYPTPIVKTVFNDEIHFRLRQGRLVHVPMQELIELMKNEWKENARKLESADETLETVGPIGNFRLQYQLQAESTEIPTDFGNLTRRIPRFNRFVMLPVSESIGQPLTDALSENSEFRKLLAGTDPRKTTISVWVYPDSFTEFNSLKEWLYGEGFMTACWPLSANSQISGGPTGYRSTAQ